MAAKLTALVRGHWGDAARQPRPFPGGTALVASDAAWILVEHGVMTGEVLGLEVARVVVDDLGAHLQVGVGKHDRHAQQLVHGDLPTEQVLEQVVQTVAERRRAGVAPHPYQRLSPERWLRCRVVDEPALVGAEHLAPVPALAVADDLRSPRPAP